MHTTRIKEHSDDFPASHKPRERDSIKQTMRGSDRGTPWSNQKERTNGNYCGLICKHLYVCIEMLHCTPSVCTTVSNEKIKKKKSTRIPTSCK